MTSESSFLTLIGCLAYGFHSWSLEDSSTRSVRLVPVNTAIKAKINVLTIKGMPQSFVVVKNLALYSVNLSPILVLLLLLLLTVLKVLPVF